MRENVLQPVQELIDAQLTFPLDRSRELGHQTGFSPNCREEGACTFVVLIVVESETCNVVF